METAIYIAGPMRGIPDFNFPAFDSAARNATMIGYDKVFNPAQMDRDGGTEVTNDDEATAVSRIYAKRDLAAILECTHIAMLPGWEKSKGARTEYALAVWIELEILDATTFRPFDTTSARAQLLTYHSEMCAKALEVMKKKNHDYAGAGNADPFANFRRTEALGICSTEASFLVRLSDKLSRLSTFVNDGRLLVTDEGVEDTLVDMINYPVLFGAFLAQKNNKA